ncbi:hypothetical protein CAEBREN_14871 [Caenorhabditis brenneri]|uniref:Uncharacterized protein n=1 Tax=Caenorhabditis brenneri TaxID=135651 RepID=G0NB99_CAEBE|nr:hypothetical protein CAEBREN_14871 [Caenorhabditis brenneri]
MLLLRFVLLLPFVHAKIKVGKLILNVGFMVILFFPFVFFRS